MPSWICRRSTGSTPRRTSIFHVSRIDQLTWEDGVGGTSVIVSQVYGIDGHTGKFATLTIHRDGDGNRLADLLAASPNGQGLRIQVAGPALSGNMHVSICVSESALSADSIKVEPKNSHLKYPVTTTEIGPEEVFTRHTSAAGFEVGRVGNKVAHGKALADQLALAANNILPDGKERNKWMRADINGTVRTGVRNGRPVREFHVTDISDPSLVLADDRARAKAREWAGRSKVAGKIRDMIGL